MFVPLILAFSAARNISHTSGLLLAFVPMVRVMAYQASLVMYGTQAASNPSTSVFIARPA